ncbi:hypothetical protein SNB56_19730, partial [Escherichia coli]|nr:hypothetical protein [Escherichia coli]MEA0887205.1 hypothetical protein [Escherichia coli]
IHILRGVRQQQDEPGRFSICSRQAAVVLVWQKKESPVVNFSLTHEAIPMLQQHQDRLLPPFTQYHVFSSFWSIYNVVGA